MRSLILLVCLLALSQSASACSVCFTNQGNAREAFIWTTALMTFVPLFLIGGGILVIRKLLKDDPDQHQLQTLPEPEQDEVVEPSKEKAEIS